MRFGHAHVGRAAAKGVAGLVRAGGGVAAAAPPSSEAQQLADMKAMFEQGLIPSREIYENKVRQILGLS